MELIQSLTNAAFSNSTQREKSQWNILQFSGVDELWAGWRVRCSLCFMNGAVTLKEDQEVLNWRYVQRNNLPLNVDWIEATRQSSVMWVTRPPMKEFNYWFWRTSSLARGLPTNSFLLFWSPFNDRNPPRLSTKFAPWKAASWLDRWQTTLGFTVNWNALSYSRQKVPHELS